MENFFFAFVNSGTIKFFYFFSHNICDNFPHIYSVACFYFIDNYAFLMFFQFSSVYSQIIQVI